MVWAWAFSHTGWTTQCILRNLVFQIFGRSPLWSVYLRMLGRGLGLKTTTLLLFFLWLVKSLKNLQITGLLFPSKKVTSYLIFSMDSGLLDQLQIFKQSHLMKLLGLLTGLGLMELWHLIYPRLLTGSGMLFFFINSNLRQFQVRQLVLIHLFSVIDSFEWFWMGSLCKNIQ